MSYYFELGSCTIAIESGLEFSQSHESINSTVVHRSQSGKAIKQTHFKKLKSILSGKGWIPTGLESLVSSEALILECTVPMSIVSKSNQISIPQGRRDDFGYVPTAFGLVNGNLK